jgi:hypothetical protein
MHASLDRFVGMKTTTDNREWHSKCATTVGLTALSVFLCLVGQDVGYENRMLLLRVDPETGKIWWDESFRSEDGSLGLSLVRNSWPHGNTGEATGHAALFVP